jgi:hypothetical protein
VFYEVLDDAPSVGISATVQPGFDLPVVSAAP